MEGIFVESILTMANRFILSFLLSTCILSAFAQNTFNMQWQRCYGGAQFENARHGALVSGGIIIVGSSLSNDGDASGHHGSTTVADGWAIKISTTGNLLWQKKLGGTDIDNLQTVAATPDGGCIAAGSTTSNDGDVSGYKGGKDAWLVRLDANGNILWQKCFGGSGLDSAITIIPTADGNYVIAGTTGSTNGDLTGLDTEITGFYRAMLTKIDIAGNVLWTRLAGSTSGTPYVGYDVVQLSNSNYLLAAADLGSNPSYVIYQITNNNSSRTFYSSLYQNSTGGPMSLFNLLLTNNYNNTDLLYTYLYKKCSRFSSNTTGRLINKLSSYENTYNGLPDACAYPISGYLSYYNIGGKGGLLPLPADHYLLAGKSSDTNSSLLPKGGTDAFVSRFQLSNSANTIFYTRMYGGSDNDQFGSILYDGTRYFAIGQSFSNDGDVSGNHGNGDIWVASFSTTNLVSNGSFEMPVQSATGSNATGQATLNGWTATGGNFTVVKTDGSSFSSGPDTANDGTQYVSLSNASGTIYKDFTINSNNTPINFGAYFSSKEASGYEDWTASVAIYSLPANTQVALSDTRLFTAADGGTENWHYLNGSATLPAGSYRIVINLGRFGNTDGGFVMETFALPITLLGFNAYYENESANLKWATGSHAGFSHFIVERSNDGRNFNTIARVDFNNQHQYTYIDATVSSNVIYFYRLKMVDADERFSYSTIIKLSTGNRQLLTIAPNPVQKDLYLTGVQPGGEIRLFKITGQQVLFNKTQSSSVTLNVAQLKAGIYILQYSNGTQTAIKKFIKQ